MLKTDGIPLWVTLFVVVTVILGLGLGVMAFLGVAQDSSMTGPWGGRSVGLGVVAALAVLMKSPATYVAALAGGVCRDVGDLVGEFARPERSTAVIAGVLAFMVIGPACLWISNRARML